jgi:intein/homing endonuclease
MTTRADEKILSIFDLPQNKFYVGISEALCTELITRIDENSKSFSKFMSKNKISTACYRWFEKREFPLCELIRITQILKTDNLEENITYVRSGRYPLEKIGGNLGEKIFVRFPLCLSKELARIIAHVFADGCISIDKNSYITGAYYNQSASLRNEFKKDIESVFSFSNLKEKINKGTEYFYLTSSISLILLCLAKTYSSKECRIPDFIKSASDNIKAEFIGAIFDDESCVHFAPPYRYIELSLCNLGLLGDVQMILSEFGIKSTKICNRKIRGFDIFSFYIRGIDDFLIFKKIVGFTDINKNKKLEQIIQNPGRHFCPNEDMKEKIVSELKSREFTTIDIAKKIGRCYSTASLVLNRLKNENLVSNRIKNKQIVWYLR